MNRRLPVTLVGGFLGAGKTSLLHHFISEHPGGHLAIFMASPGPVNLDARAVRGLCGAARRLYDQVLEIPAGDEAMQIEWLAAQLREASRSGRFEQALVEVEGTANAARLGRHFGWLPGHPETLAPWAELHQIVCVVDALDFYRGSVLPDRTGDPNGFVNFQQAQIEGASLLVLNKCDLMEDASREACTRRLRSINPGAPIIETDYGEVPPEVWAKTATPPQLGQAIEPPRQSAEATINSASPELTSTLYRVYRPFHPERFWKWFNADHPGLLRVKGLIWLATRNLLVGGISRTRWQNGCGSAGIWWAALPREDWPEDEEALARMQETWREPYGDRRQELILIGAEGNLPSITRGLEACLLTAEEYARPVREWIALPDPFPAWDVDGE